MKYLEGGGKSDKKEIYIFNCYICQHYNIDRNYNALEKFYIQS